MKSRIVWFVAGSAAGVYSAAKARRVAYRLSAPGVVDQAAALGVGWRAFSSEMRVGMTAREQQIARTLADRSAPTSLGLDEAHPEDIPLAEAHRAPLDKKAT
ncbi:DUF6167 family protein [Aeromicrobium wangtongii]|uniref:DUF6167 family protein n=1 Tax=Aeromicrobium wangtongii TaxID=2969247 RepID=UPI00201758A0|nr:DUF6167 family protein [Aeromicrobium wangtongii]MCL3819098.1 DUF6167 family protein [Aeromicrobium wangtongii]